MSLYALLATGVVVGGAMYYRNRVGKYQEAYGPNVPLPNYRTLIWTDPKSIPDDLVTPNDRQLWALVRMMHDENKKEMEEKFSNNYTFSLTTYPDRKKRLARGRLGYWPASDVSVALAKRMSSDADQAFVVDYFKKLGVEASISIDQFPKEDDPTCDDIYINLKKYMKKSMTDMS